MRLTIGDARRRSSPIGAKTARRGGQWVRLVAALLALALTLAGPFTGRTPAGADGCAGDGPAPYLHTCGTQIVDASGAPVTLHAVNWYGFDSNDFVAGGLRYQSYQAIVDRIKALGFNALRIPFSDELIERDPVVSALGPICAHLSCLPNSGADALGPNSGLYGLDALTILKTIVDYAGGQGLYVILDDHRSQAAWGPQENGLWYTDKTCAATAEPYSCYTPQSWLDDWRKLGAFFAGDPYVTGLDLRNEPHSAHQPSTCAGYLASGHWGACGGANNNDTDWQQAASAAGAALLSIDPHWLIVVEGVSTFPQGDGSFPDDGWGENLQGAAVDPVALTAPGGGDHLVYSPHDYRFSNSNNNVSTDTMRAAWLRDFGYLVAAPAHSYSAPVWVGEFGTCTHANNCIVNTAFGSAGAWFSAVTQYVNNGDPSNGIPGAIGWSYWPVNGTYSDSWSYAGNHWQTCYGQRENYGVLGSDWSTLAAPLMQSVLFPPSPTPSPVATDSPTTTPTNAPSGTPTIPPSRTPTVTATATAIPTLTRTTFATPTVTATVAPTVTAPTAPTVTAPTVTATALARASLTTPLPATVVSATATVVSATEQPSATASASASAAATATATATATASASATTAPSSTPPPTSTVIPPPTSTVIPPPTSTVIPPAPSQWPSFACAPYSITPTPSATATPPIKIAPLAPSQPTATVTAIARPRPRVTAVRRAPTRQSSRHIQTKPPRKTQPAPPLIRVYGSTLRKAVRLDVQVRRDGRGRLSGWLRYTDTRKGKRLNLYAVKWRAASTSCGRLHIALVQVRLRDGNNKRKTYDAAFSVGLDTRHTVRFSLRLGRAYNLSATLTGAAAITCPSRPSTRKPAYKAPAHAATHKGARRATTGRKPALRHATTGRKPASRGATGQQAPRKAPMLTPTPAHPKR